MEALNIIALKELKHHVMLVRTAFLKRNVGKDVEKHSLLHCW